MSVRHPPRVPAWLLGRYFAWGRQSESLGDLTELFEVRQRSRGRFHAAVWFWSQLVSFPLHRLRERFHGIRSPSSGRPDGTQPRRRGAGIGAFSQDLRYAVRRLRQSPGFTAIAVTIMGLGIGANTAIFSIVNAVLFKSLPYEQPQELVRLFATSDDGTTPSAVSFPDFLDYRDRQDLFEGVVAHTAAVVSLVTDDGPEVVFSEYLSADFFRLVGIAPVLGRAFVASEDEIGTEAVAMVSHRAWVRRYGADPAVIGATVRLNGRPVTVVGVGPKDFTGTMVGLSTDFWIPLGTAALIEQAQKDARSERGQHRLSVTARLAEGVTVEQATLAMDVFGRQLAEEYPETNANRNVITMRANDVRLHPFIDAALYPVAGFLMAVVGLVLLVACTNLANLLLVRASSRRKEVAVRLAMGATRRRLVSQLLTESTLLGVLGGLLGLVFAYWTARFIATVQPPIPVPMALDIRLDATVLGFAVVLSVATGVIFGLVPSLRASRPNVVATLRDESRLFGRARHRFGLTNVLVVGQVAVSLMLLIVAGLFLRGVSNAQRVDPGFETTNIAMATLPVEFSGFAYDDVRGLLRELTARLESHAGVSGIALADRVPLAASLQTMEIVVDNSVPLDDAEAIDVDYVHVSPEFFEVMQVPILRGRKFASSDRENAPQVAIVSAAMARRFWGTEDVVGRQLRTGDSGTLMEIVGVARDIKVRTLGEGPRPLLYRPFEQNRSLLLFASVIVATDGDPAAMPETFRREVSAINSNFPLYDARTMREHIGVMLFAPKLGATLLSAFGMLAMVLASIGLYGVVAYSVARRTREVGIRVALGADRMNVVGMVVREGMAMVSVGVVIGLALSAVVMRPIAGFLYGVAPTDLVTFGSVAALLYGVALLATYVPARRAARIDPMIALRYE